MTKPSHCEGICLVQMARIDFMSRVVARRLELKGTPHLSSHHQRSRAPPLARGLEFEREPYEATHLPYLHPASCVTYLDQIPPFAYRRTAQTMLIVLSPSTEAYTFFGTPSSFEG